MKNTDESKIKDALISVSRLKYREEKDGGNDFSKGMACMADIMFDVIFKHGASDEYKTAVRDLLAHARN